jgi:putative RNA 2'-phosphotransferase
MIRAIYGHSIKQTIFYQPSLPPEILYHGTVEPFVTSIINQNLKPMSRQYVHLSPDINMAKKVAARKGTDIVILQIQAFNAYNNGVEFYKASDYVWLSKEIPSKYITR